MPAEEADMDGTFITSFKMNSQEENKLKFAGEGAVIFNLAGIKFLTRYQTDR